jgi:hypothetical protein
VLCRIRGNSDRRLTHYKWIELIEAAGSGYTVEVGFNNAPALSGTIGRHPEDAKIAYLGKPLA